MTYARSILIPKGSAGTFHCVSRCVRRAFLCGEDRLTGRSFEHRRQWVEDRIHELAGIFGVAIWGYAVMSNHVHVVVEILPEAVAKWSDDEVAQRWTRLYPRQDQNAEMRAEMLAGNAERIMELRERLANLSWFMRCLVEPIARAANREDICKGRFWEGRFKCQALLDEEAVLAAIAYVDLNPVRAKICDTLEASVHTSARVERKDTHFRVRQARTFRRAWHGCWPKPRSLTARNDRAGRERGKPWMARRKRSAAERAGTAGRSGGKKGRAGRKDTQVSEFSYKSPGTFPTD